MILIFYKTFLGLLNSNFKLVKKSPVDLKTRFANFWLVKKRSPGPFFYSHSTTKQRFRNVDITVFLAKFDYFGDNFGDLFDNDWLPLNCIIVLFACLIEIKPVISSDNSLSTPDHK